MFFSTQYTVKNLLRDIAVCAVRFADKPAVRDASSFDVTYAELARLSDSLAYRLFKNGAKPGASLAYLGPNGTEHIVTFIACLKAGLNHVPINRRFPDGMVHKIVNTLDADFIMATDYHTILPSKAIHIDIPKRDDIPPTRSLPFTPVDVEDQSFAGVACSSGSTGIPKLVPVTREAIASYVRFFGDQISCTSDDVLGHGGNLWFEEFGVYLSVGATIVCFDPLDGSLRERMDWIENEGITAIMTYPALFRSMATEKRKLPKLRVVAMAGESLDHNDLQLFTDLTNPGAVLINTYSQQEFMCGTVNRYFSCDPIPHGDFPAGTPWVEAGLHVVCDNGKLADKGQIGEITYRSRLVTPGYIGAPERTTQSIQTKDDGLRVFSTGDLGFIDTEGKLHVLGRKDDQIKICGFTLRPSEIEREIQDIPEVDIAVVATDYCPSGNPRMVCFYCGNIDARALRKELSGFMAAFMIPQFFVHKDDMPRTATGKIIRGELYLPKKISDTLRVYPETTVEQTVFDIWLDILGHGNFGVTDCFYDVGGDSLTALELLLEYERTTGLRISMDAFVLSGATIRLLCEEKANKKKAFRRLLKPGKETSEVHLCHDYNGEVSLYLELVLALPRGIQAQGLCANYYHRRSTYSYKEKVIEGAAVVPTDRSLTFIGYSYGGMIAAEVARECTKKPVDLFLIDPYSTYSQSSYKRLYNWIKIRLVSSGFLDKEIGHRGDFSYKPSQLNVRRAAIVYCDSTRKASIGAWTASFNCELKVFRVPGTHREMMRGSNAILIAEFLSEWLEAGKK